MVKQAVKGESGNFRATFEDKILLSDIVFLKAWVPIEPKAYYNPVTSLLDNWDGGMKTVSQLRRDKNLPIPSNSNSVYKPIEREERKFFPLKIPESIQQNLPFKSKPKLDAAITSSSSAKRKKSKRGEVAERRSLVLHNKEEKNIYTLVQQLNTVRIEKEKKRSVSNKERMKEREKKKKKEEEKFQVIQKGKRKAEYRKMGQMRGDRKRQKNE